MGLITGILIGTGAIAAGIAAATDERESPTIAPAPNRRRTKEDYLGTSFSVKYPVSTPVTPTTTMLKTTGTTAYTTQTASAPSAPDIKNINPYGTTRTFSKEPEFNYYNDPYQVNSMADVLLNKKGKDLVLKDLKAEWATDVPVLQELIVAADYLKRSYLDPFEKTKGLDGIEVLDGIKSAFLQAGANALYATGEHMDIIANPVKGLIIDGPKGLIQGFGGGDTGRTQYDYNANTGNKVFDFVVNMAAEIVSDPTNLVQLGTSEFMQQGISNVLDRTARTTASEISEDVVKEGVAALTDKYNKSISQQLALQYAAKGKVNITDIMKNTAGVLLTSGASEQAIELFYRNASDAVDIINASNIFNSIYKIGNVADSVDKFLIKTSPLGLGLSAAGKLVGNKTGTMLTWIKNAYTKKFYQDAVTPANIMDAVTFSKISNRIETYHKVRIGSMYDKVISNVDKTIGAIDSGKLNNTIDFNTLSKLYRKYGLVSKSTTDNMVEYLDNLLLDGQITKETYTFLKADSNFVPYYNSIVEDATLKNTLRRTMYDSNVTKARVSEIVKGSNTTYDAAINIVDMFNNTLGYQDQITTPVDFSKFINSKVAQTNKRIKFVQEQIDLLDAGVSPKKLKEQLDLLGIQKEQLESIKTLFDSVINDLGIDITSIPDPAVLKEVLTVREKDPKIIPDYINTKKIATKNEIDNLSLDINKLTAEQKQLEQDIKIGKDVTEAKTRLYEIKDTLADDKRMQAIYKREINNYDAVKKYLATPSLSKITEPADVVTALHNLDDPQFVEANTNLLRTVAADTSDIDLYFKVNDDGTLLYDKPYVTDASRTSTKKVIDTQRLIVADDINTLIRNIDNEYTIIGPSTTAKEIDLLKKENADILNDWDNISKTYDIIDTVENFNAKDQAIKNQLANDPTKSYKDLVGKTEKKTLDDYLIAFDKYYEFSPDYIKQIKKNYKQGTSVLQQLDNYNNTKQMPSFNKELDLTDLDPKTKAAYTLLSNNTLATNKDIEEAMEILNSLDAGKYDVEQYHNKIISTLFVGDDKNKYVTKTQQLQVHKELINGLAQNPATHQLVYDLANNTNDSVVGSVLNNILDKSNTLNSNSISFSLDSIKRLKDVAKSHVAYEQLMTNALTKLSDADPKIGVAFLDYISGLNMRDKIAVINELMPDGVINLKLLKDMVDMRYNGNTSMYALKNSDLASYFNFDIDVNKLHNAAYDTEVGMFVQSKLIDEKVLPKPKKGQVYTYFDLETTGLGDKVPDQVVQITAVKYRWNGDSFEVVDSLDKYASLNRGYTFDKSTLKTKDNPDGIFDTDFINNVKYSNVKEADLLKEFKTFAEGTLVGHNIERFDIPFFEKRANDTLVDFNKVTDIQDTYLAARKLFGAKEIKNDTINKLGIYLQQYIDSTQELNTTKFIKLFDADSANSLFDIGKDLADLTLNNKNSNTLLEHMDANNYERAFEGLLGKTDLTSINKELKPNTSELQDVIKGCDINSNESLIGQVRDILASVKASNNVMQEYVITKEMLEDYSSKVLREKNLAFDYQVKLNAFGITNGAYIDNAGKTHITPEYHLGQWGTHKLKPTYENSVTKLIRDDVTEPLAVRDSLVDAIETIDSPNADVVAKVQAFDTLGANGSNYVQASRIKAAVNDYTNNATNALNLDDRIESVMANGNAEVRTDMDLAIDYTNKIQTMSSKEYKELNNKICIADVHSKLDPDRTPQQITAHITDKSGGLGVITDINNKEYSELVKRIKQQEAEFEALGYTLKQDGDTLYILATDRDKVIANSQAVAGEYNIKHHQYDYADKEQAIFDSAQTIHNRFNAIRGTSNATTTPYDFASNLSYADTFYASSRIHGDLYKGTLLDDPDWIERYYTTRTPRYTEGVVGSLKGQRSFNSMYTMPLNHNVNLIDKSIRRVDGRNKFIQLYFNNDLSINGKFFNDLSDQELFDAYKTKSQDNVFLILVEDKKSGKPYVRTIKPNSVKDMPYLRHMNAVLTPQYNANSIIRTINKDVFDNKFKTPIVQFYYKYIISTYTSLYLTSIGMLARNFGDIMVKNIVEGTPEQIPETLLSFIKAFTDWNWYEKVTREIKDNYRTINSQTIDLYLKRLANGDANKLIKYNNLFKELHEYATSNVSAGMSAAQEEMLCQFYNKYGSRKALKDYEWYMDGVKPSAFDTWFFKDNALRKVNKKAMDINNLIEHSGRISNLRLGLAKGMSESDAYSRVLRTHFDYGMKSKAQMYAELIFPFVTFPIYNLQYWTDAVYKSPWLMEMLIDQSRSSLDIEQQKQFTLDNSQALQAAFLNGNVKIGDTLFKLNPSLMDAFQMVSTPFETIEQRLVAPIKFGVKALTEKDYIKNRYVNESVTNLTKFKNAIDDAGLYPVRRPIDTVATLATKGVTGLESFVPSLATRYVQKYGAKLGENFNQVKLKTSSGTRYFTTRSTTGQAVSSKYYPKISTTAGRSYSRIPSVNRYYSGSYNIYNRWKANRITPYALSKLGSPESLQYAFKNLSYKLTTKIDSRRKLRLYQLKQRYMYKTK